MTLLGKIIKKSDFIITENHYTRLGEDAAESFVVRTNSGFDIKDYCMNNQITLTIILQ